MLPRRKFLHLAAGAARCRLSPSFRERIFESSKPSSSWSSISRLRRLSALHLRRGFLAQPHRGLLLQVCLLGSAPYPAGIEAAMPIRDLREWRILFPGLEHVPQRPTAWLGWEDS